MLLNSNARWLVPWRIEAIISSSSCHKGCEVASFSPKYGKREKPLQANKSTAARNHDSRNHIACVSYFRKSDAQTWLKHKFVSRQKRGLLRLIRARTLASGDHYERAANRCPLHSLSLAPTALCRGQLRLFIHFRNVERQAEGRTPTEVWNALPVMRFDNPHPMGC